jgi:hypothetical protein
MSPWLKTDFGRLVRKDLRAKLSYWTRLDGLAADKRELQMRIGKCINSMNPLETHRELKIVKWIWKLSLTGNTESLEERYHHPKSYKEAVSVS